MNVNTTENRMLSDDELEGAAGGFGISVQSANFIGEVRPEAGVIGKEYYFVNGTNWYRGQLVESTPRNVFPGDPERVLKFHVTIHNGLTSDMDMTVNSSLVKLYNGMGVAL